MSKCKNCGHDSHCGIPLWKENSWPWQRNDGLRHLDRIEVCKHCRCEKCIAPDWG